MIIKKFHIILTVIRIQYTSMIGKQYGRPFPQCGVLLRVIHTANSSFLPPVVGTLAGYL